MAKDFTKLEGEECGCGSPNRWLNDPDTPIEYDSEMNEYNLKSSTGTKWSMRYCFFCGGLLPRSTRDQLFMKPDPEEVAEAKQMLRGAKTVEEVVKRLGPPDDIKEMPSGSKGRPGEYYRKQLDYRSKWKTIEFNVFEYPDGSVSYMWGGKYIKPAQNSPV